MKTSLQPTVRSIAAVAGVSATTVALALRNAPRISAATKQRVKKIAAAQGYRPDPVIGRLMHHMRTRRGTKEHASVCVLAPPAGAMRFFSARLIAGIRKRAEALGYVLSVVPFHNDNAVDRSLSTSLRNRGVEGVILLPFEGPPELMSGFDCRHFCVVAATSAQKKPVFHSVVPNHFDNMMLVWEKLRAGGARRIGLAFSAGHDLRVRHRSAGAAAWQMFFGQTEAVPPLIQSTLAEDEIARWLRTERPRVVVCDHAMGEAVAAVLARGGFGTRPRLVTTNWPSAFAVAGVDQCEAEIGAAAVDLLTGMIHRGETGIPSNPRVTMINGVWRSR